MKIMIVDDSEVLCERLTQLIGEIAGAEVVGYARGTGEAMEKVDILNPDVVILDIRLADGNGINVLAQIKNAHPGIYVLMFTNYPYLLYREKCFSAGADYFFCKSTEFEKLIEVIRYLTDEFVKIPHK